MPCAALPQISPSPIPGSYCPVSCLLNFAFSRRSCHRTDSAQPFQTGHWPSFRQHGVFQSSVGFCCWIVFLFRYLDVLVCLSAPVEGHLPGLGDQESVNNGTRVSVQVFTPLLSLSAQKLDCMAGCSVLPVLDPHTLPGLTTFVTHISILKSRPSSGENGKPLNLNSPAAPSALLFLLHSGLPLTESPALCCHLLPFITTSVQPTLWERGCDCYPK